MPICELRPWRRQYFEGYETDSIIPTEDSKAWEVNARHRWIYDKLAVALSQGLDAGPHGTIPTHFPVFSKPITNIGGMGANIHTFDSLGDYLQHQTPGHMWVTLLKGRHLSSDVAVVEGHPCWWRHATGKPSGGGTFDYWTVHAEAEGVIEDTCGAWIRQHLAGYTGMLNIETIGGRIIEGHLRFAAQWPDLYGRGWVEALVDLYERSDWSFRDDDRRDGYSVVLFAPTGRMYRHPSREIMDDIKRMEGVSSVQFPFYENVAPELHSMPPGGFRVAIINGFNLNQAIAARERLRDYFLGTH